MANSMKVWVQQELLFHAICALPNGAVEEAVKLPESDIYSLLVPEPEAINLLPKLNTAGVIAKLHYPSSEEGKGEVTGIMANIRGRNHSMYQRGLSFTTYNDVDVEFHLKSKTVTQSRGADRIEVGQPEGGWHDLDDFVARSFREYAIVGLKHTEREHHLVIYAKPDTVAKQQMLISAKSSEIRGKS